MPNHLSTAFWGLRDRKQFIAGLQTAINEATGGVFTGDNLFTFCKNLSFIDDTAFMQAWARHADNEAEKAIIWRTHILAWAAKIGLRRPGDFVECCCYRGTSAAILCDYLGFAECAKTFWLYDAFETHPALPEGGGATEHGDDLFRKTCARFAHLPNVRVLKGLVPAVLRDAPAEIAWLHLDMNSAPGEQAALEALFDRIVPGGMIVLDDYGYSFYRAQKLAHDRFFGAHGCPIAELPTGQGLVIKL